MPSIDEVIDGIAAQDSWDGRVLAIRRVPESFGTALQREAYSRIARRIYVPELSPDFAYIHPHADYDLEALSAAYEAASEMTSGFTRVGVEDIAAAILKEPRVLRIFRLILGLLPQEFAAATQTLEPELGFPSASGARVKAIEGGATPPEDIANCCAEVVDRAMSGQLFPSLGDGITLKQEKPDTEEGWASVQLFAQRGVPYSTFLHQRHYGGAFRQLLDATSTKRGDVLEDAVELLFQQHEVLYIRTGSHNQREIADKFGVTVQPAPDFAVHDSHGALRAILECKSANDGGTARDKASRYRALRQEAGRLGGIPVFAVLAGLGWARTADALGPVVRDTDGRVFTLRNLAAMLTTQPFPGLLPNVA